MTGKRIAFIDRCARGPKDSDSLMDRTRFEDNKRIIRALETRYWVVPYEELCRDTYEELKKDHKQQAYDAIITHVPYNEDPDKPGRHRTYGESLGLLDLMNKEFHRIRIIAHTGASPEDVSDRALHNHGVSLVLRRSMPLTDNDHYINFGRIVSRLG